MKRLLIFATLLTSVLALTACAAATVEPVTPTAIPSDTPLPSPTKTLSLPTPDHPITATQPVEESPTQGTLPPAVKTPIPGIPASIVNDFEGFLYGGSDCSLPCWHGLNVTESVHSEVQSTFTNLFDLSTEQGVFSDYPVEHRYMPGIFAEQFVLETEQPSDLFLDVNLWFSLDTTILEGLSVSFFVGEEEEHKFSMERILETFGEPDHLVVGEQGSGSPDSSLIHVLAIYNEGFAFFHGGLIPRSKIDEQFVSEYCLARRLTWKSLKLFGNLDSDFHELTPLQGLLLGTEIVDRDLVPAEEMLMVDKAEITQRAIEEENPCFEFPSRYR